MKRQALAFFTMFSLLMMLSIYYISLPSDLEASSEQVGVMQEETDTEKEGDKGTEKVEDKDTETELNNEVMADSSSSEQEKTDALLNNEAVKEQESQEEEYSSVVLALGYQNSVEIDKNTILVTIEKEAESDEVVSNVLKTLHEHLESSFFIEVRFNS